MQNFVHGIPTTFYHGKDTHKQLGEVVKGYGCDNIMLVYDPFLENGKWLEEVRESLKSSGVNSVELTGVQPNPVLSLVHKGVDIAKKNKVQMVVGFGGGSTIDTAKAIAIGAVYDGDVWDYFCNLQGVHPVFNALPIGAIITIAATGSESSAGTIITNEDGWLKWGCGGPAVFPKFAIENPEITCSLPAWQTACGIADMFSHVAERYFTNTPNTYIIDALDEAAFRTLRNIGPKLVKDLNNYDLRSEIMWTGTIAHNDTLGVGREQDWASHDFGHELSAIYGITHGSAVTMSMIAWMKYVYKHDVKRFKNFAIYGMEVNPEGKDDETIALEGIETFEQWIKELGLPTRLSEYPNCSIDDSRFEEMANKALMNRPGSIGFFVKLNKEDIINVYKLALK